MKKIYTLLIALLALNTLSAQTWDFGSTDFFEIGDITSDTTISGLTVYATGEKDVTFDANGKSIDDYEFTGRLKFNGSKSFSEGTPVARIVGFDVSGDCYITVYGCSSSSSSERICMIANADGELLDSLVTTDIASKVVNYTGDATTVYMYSKSSGFNLYYISVSYGDAPAALNEIARDKEILKTKYYNLNGVSIGERADYKTLPQGIYIKLITFADGSMLSTKELKTY